MIAVPLEWVIDGTEIYYGGSSNNKKRISPSIDAGYVTQSATYNGRSLHRQVDEEATQEAGYEILVDTNNSSADFYERENHLCMSDMRKIDITCILLLCMVSAASAQTYDIIERRNSWNAGTNVTGIMMDSITTSLRRIVRKQPPR